MRSGQGVWIAVVTGVLVPILTLALVVAARTPAPKAPTLSDGIALQSIADKACGCARRAWADKRKCWAAFDKIIAGRQNGTMADACMPVSTRMVCLDSADNCVIIERNGGELCSNEEARAIEAIWSHELANGGSEQRAWDRANAAIARASDGFARGEKPRVPRDASPGCGG